MARVTVATVGPVVVGYDTSPPPWPPFRMGVWVDVGSRFVADDRATWEVVQGHVTQWEPATVPALFKRVRAPFDPWLQPLGSSDAYPAVDDDGAPTTVTHADQSWRNSHGGGNVWEPGVYGWEPVDVGSLVAGVWIEGFDGVGASVSAASSEHYFESDGARRSQGAWPAWVNAGMVIRVRWVP